MQAARGASLNHSDQADPVPSRPRVDARLVFAAVALLAYGLDLASKQWALSELADGDIPVLGDWLTLHLTFNPGAAFSTGTRYTEVFTCLAIAAIVVILFLARRIGSLGWAVALGLLLAGVGGNLTDRMLREPGPLRGHVIDFFMLPHWPVFNVADICINVAAALIIWLSWRGVPLRGRQPERPDVQAAPAD